MQDAQCGSRKPIRASCTENQWQAVGSGVTKRHCSAREPCALKDASTVRRGAVGNGLPQETTRKEFWHIGGATIPRWPPTLRRGCSGWMSSPQLFLPNYAYSTSRSYAPSTQVSDYGGVAEAARIYPKRSVTSEVFKNSSCLVPFTRVRHCVTLRIRF